MSVLHSVEQKSKVILVFIVILYSWFCFKLASQYIKQEANRINDDNFKKVYFLNVERIFLFLSDLYLSINTEPALVGLTAAAQLD